MRIPPDLAAIAAGPLPATDQLHMSFGIYIAGIVLVLGGLIYGAAILHAPVPWIVVGALVLLGLGILAAVKATRQRDRAS
jgi:hypothetical protein